MSKETAMFGADTISVYTRAQAIADGELIDVSEMAKEAGFAIPVALTSALFADIHTVPADRPWQSFAGRLWDVLSMLLAAIQGRIPSEGDDQTKVFSLYMATQPGGTGEDFNEDFDKDFSPRDVYQVKAVCGPGDEAEPVLTLMKPDED